MGHGPAFARACGVGSLEEPISDSAKPLREHGFNKWSEHSDGSHTIGGVLVNGRVQWRNVLRDRPIAPPVLDLPLMSLKPANLRVPSRRVLSISL